LVAAAALGWVGSASAASFVLTAQRVDLDADRGVVRAWQVRITDGLRVVTAPELVLDRGAGLGTLSGGVTATGPEGHLRGRTARIRFTRSLELVQVEADGDARLQRGRWTLSADQLRLDTRSGVATAQGQPARLEGEQVTAIGTRVVYRSRQEEAELGSPARFETQEGALQGSSATFRLRGQTARVAGPVAFRFAAGQGSAREAVADFARGRVDLVGQVRVRWRSSVLEGQRVVVWYREGRVLVEGPSRMRVEEEDLPRTP
jgi:lipopolysaccharide export system protein LptA